MGKLIKLVAPSISVAEELKYLEENGKFSIEVNCSTLTLVTVMQLCLCTIKETDMPTEEELVIKEQLNTMVHNIELYTQETQAWVQ